MLNRFQRLSNEKKLFYFAVLLIVSSFFMMGQVSKSFKKADDDQFWEFAAMFNEVYKEVKDRYVDPVDSKKLFEGALQGMFLTLDPHSQYMDPDSYSQLEKDTEGAFSGVGIHITLRDGVLTVIAPMPGSPAAKAGVRPWDRILEIEGKKTEGISLIEAVKKLTGPTGTTVNITVYREGETEMLHFTLVRKNIKVESIYSRMLEHNIGYARIARFSDNTARDLRRAIEGFKEKNAKGVIVDLRYNTGGLLKEAVETSNLFVGRGKLIVSTKGRIKSQNQEFRATSDPVTDLPLLVLINNSSASASEIFAGAMKDLGRGTIVGIKGQRSFGKGSVQTIEQLTHSFEKDDNGNYRPAAIRLTTAKYYTPSGVSIDKIGVTPDIALEMPKGQFADLLKHGLYGDPPTEEGDNETTKSKFSWKKGEKKEGETSVSQSLEENKDQQNPDDESLAGSAVLDKKDGATTGPQPKRIIPIDRSQFPDAEIEGEPKKPDTAKKTNNNKPFVDYQLEVAQRLMEDHILKSKDFLAPDAGQPTAVPVAPVADAGKPAAKQ